jgi:hypothetical protein
MHADFKPDQRLSDATSPVCEIWPYATHHNQNESLLLSACIRIYPRLKNSKLQPHIFAVALRAFADFGAGRPGVEMAAADAMKRGLAALALEAGVIASVVVKPQAEKDRRDNQAIDDDRSGQGEHGTMLAEMSGGAKRRMAEVVFATKDRIELKERLFSAFFVILRGYINFRTALRFMWRGALEIVGRGLSPTYRA